MPEVLENEVKNDEVVTPQNLKPGAYSEFSIFSGQGGTLPTSSLATDYTSATGGTFGGNGSNGALSITTGTTTIDLGSVSVFTRNYTSISITGTGVLNFTSPHDKGTVVILKSKGNVTLTSSTAPMIDCSGLGALAGTGGVARSGNGTDGTGGINNILLETNFPDNGNLGNGGNVTGGGGGAASTANKYSFPGDSIATAGIYGYLTQFSTGGGGAGGGAGDGDSDADSGDGAAGGRGGGVLIIECGGALNFTTTNGISIAGKNGSVGESAVDPQGGAGGGGGGGGAGGIGIVIYNTLTAASGTINVSGGNGGNGGNGTANVGGDRGAGGGGSGGANRYAGGAGGAGGDANTAGTNGSAGGGTGGGSGGTGGSAGGGVNNGGGGGGGGGGSAGNSYIVQNIAFA